MVSHSITLRVTTFQKDGQTFATAYTDRGRREETFPINTPLSKILIWAHEDTAEDKDNLRAEQYKIEMAWARLNTVFNKALIKHETELQIKKVSQSLINPIL